jgi:phosphoribosylformylglycinamidine (FGAM) synthase-like enzyme
MVIRGNTVQRPGGDAAVVRIEGNQKKALAMTTDCTPRYCRPIRSRAGKQAVAETWRNITAVGGRRWPSPTT